MPDSCANAFRPDDGLVVLHRVAGEARHEPRRAGQLFGPHTDADTREEVAARPDRHHDLFERGVAGALAEPVHRALDLARAVGDARERVRDGHAEVVVAVRRDDVVAVDRRDDVRDQLPVLVGNTEPDGVGDVQCRRAVVDRELQHLAEEVDVGAAAVLGRELDVVGVALGPGDAAHDLGLHLLLGHAELLRHVDRRRGDEDVDPGPLRVAHRLPRPVDVLEARPGEPGDDRSANGLRDRLDRLEVTVARDREAGLDHVDAEAGELLRDLELLADVEGDPRRLLTVSQRGVEDQDLVRHVSLASLGLFGQRAEKRQ